MTQRLLQQAEGADDIGLNECRRSVDRAVDVAFGGEISPRGPEHVARTGVAARPRRCRRLVEAIARMVRRLSGN